MVESYRTLKDGGEDVYEVKRSRFLALAAPAADEQAAREIVKGQEKKYFDARHTCYAWVLGEKGNRQKSSDGGEPGGTAGSPILEAIKAKDLTNTVVVVTRYFGGIKLGAGGLARAYGHAASLAIAAATPALMVTMCRLSLTFAYSHLGAIENFLRQKNIAVSEKNFSADVRLTALVDPAEIEAAKEAVDELTAAGVAYEELGWELSMVPL